MNYRQATGRWATGVFTAGLSTWLGLLAAPALAQQAASVGGRPAKVYAGASGLFTSQPGTSLGEQSGDTPLEGSGLTFSGMVGAGGRLSVEAQVTRGPELNGFVDFQTSGGVATYTSTFRDTLVSAFVRYRGSPSRRVLVEPVGGVTLAFGSGTTTNAFVPDATGIPQYSYESDSRRRSVGFGGGVDFLVRTGRRAAVGGLLRVHRLVWNDEEMTGAPNVGLGAWVYQAGAVVRVDLAPPPAEAGVSPGPSPGSLAKRRGYVGGFAGLFVQPVGEVDGHYLTEGVGGNGLGFGGTAGAFIARHWSLAAEVAVGPEFEAQSSFAGRIRFDTRYRDTLISALARWHPMPSAPVQLEPVFGGTVAVGHAPRTETWINWSGGEEEPTDATITRISFGAVGGADVVAGTGPLAAVASFRLHVIDRNDVRNDQPPELGVGSFVYIIAGGLRWRF